MKRFLLLIYIFSITLVVLFTANTLFAKPIDINTASLVAKNQFIFLKAKSSKGEQLLKNIDVTLAYERSEIVNKQTQQKEPVYYIFNNKASGWLIVSGDDKSVPIIAYSFTGSYSDTKKSPEFSAWMDDLSKEIIYFKNNNIQNTGTAEEWNKLLLSEKQFQNSLQANNDKIQSVGPLLQTQWNQSPYYNDFCPYDYTYSDRTVTGCVATAMAQVMKYWNYPKVGSGFNSYDTQNYGTLSANFGNTTYQWASMQNSLNSSNSAVATLMYHCGVSVNMTYGTAATGGSEAYVISSASPITNCAEYAFKTYFGYKSTLQGLQRASYTDAQWTSLLKTELDASRPILYAGFGNAGGHCFVCDGYDNNGYFHFNWGWGGESDGYFYINALNPSALGTGGGGGGFNSGHQAVIGIEAPQQTAQSYDLKLYDFVTASASSIYYGQSFDVNTNIINDGMGNFTGDYCAAVFDDSLNFVDFIEIKSNWSLPAGDVYQTNVTFSTNGMLGMLPGRYFVGIFYRPTGGNWSAVADNANYINETEIDVTNPNPIELYTPITIQQGLVLTQGQPVTVNLDIYNGGNTAFSGAVDVSLYNLDSTGSFATTIQTITGLSLPAGYHFTNGLTFTNSNLNVPPGTYLMALIHKPDGGNVQLTGNGQYQNPIKVIVQQQPLQPDKYEVNNTFTQSYNLPVNFTNNTANVNTQGSNCHVGNDLDFYKINLPKGYDYTIKAKLYNNSNSQNYTLDALVSYSTDGTNWSNADADVSLADINISVNYQGTVYFLVAPLYTGLTGTYLLDMNITRTISSGVDDKVPVNFDFQLYPNPVSQNINIKFNSSDNISEVQIIDVLGNVLYTVSKDNLSTGNLNVDVSNFPTGMYYVSAKYNGDIIFKKFEVIK